MPLTKLTKLERMVGSMMPRNDEEDALNMIVSLGETRSEANRLLAIAKQGGARNTADALVRGMLLARTTPASYRRL